MLSIECEIESLKLVIKLLPNTSIEEERLHLHSLDETRREATLNVEAHKERVKSQYDKVARPRVFLEEYLVLVYEQNREKLRAGKFEPLWYVPLISKIVLK